MFKNKKEYKILLEKNLTKFRITGMTNKQWLLLLMVTTTNK